MKVESKNGADDTIIDGIEAEVVVNITSDNVTFNGFTIQNGQTGIKVVGNNNNIIYNSIGNIAGAKDGESGYGICLNHVTNNNVSYNKIYNIKGIKGSICITYSQFCNGGDSYGIHLKNGTNNHLSNNMIISIKAGISGVIQPNTISVIGGNGGNGYGVFLDSGTNNRIFSNIIEIVYGNNGGAGIYCYYPPGYLPAECYGRGGKGGNGYGIFLSSENNEIFNNVISDAQKGAGGNSGVVIGSSGRCYCIAASSISNKNVIYNNNFVNPDGQVGFDSSGNNTWDKGPIIGGNYWSDYSGNDSNNDGIGDIPYELTGYSGAKDNYPLLWTGTTAPVITNVVINTITNNTATITWDTNEASDSLIKYGTKPGNYTNQEFDAAIVTSHSITLTGLSPDTTYYFVVNCTDASDNSNENREYSFITANGLTLPPNITNVVTTSLTTNSATVIWNTDKTSDSLIKYHA